MSTFAESKTELENMKVIYQFILSVPHLNSLSWASVFYFFPPLQENNKNQSNFSQSFVYYLVIMVFALFIYRQAIPLSSSVINKVL